MKKYILILLFIPLFAKGQGFNSTAKVPQQPFVVIKYGIDTTRISNDSLKVFFTQPIETYKDTTHTAVLRQISDSITSLINTTIRNNDSLQLVQIIDSLVNLTAILNELKHDCIGSNETYYINGTNTISINSSEVCSYTITVIEDTIGFTENGVTSPFNLPTGYSGTASFRNASNYLINSISFTGSSASSKAIIKIIK